MVEAHSGRADGKRRGSAPARGSGSLTVPIPVATALAAVLTWFPHSIPIYDGDPFDHVRVAWRACLVCAPERREGLFKLYVAWAGRESDGLPLLSESGGKHRGPLCLNEGEAVAAAVRVRWLSKKPTDAQRNRIWHLYATDEDMATMLSVDHAAYLLESADWKTIPGVMAHCGTQPDASVRAKYLPRLMYLYWETWREAFPLTLAPDTP